MGWHVRFVPKAVMNFEDGRPEICQLVAYNLTDIVIKGLGLGPGRPHLVPCKRARCRCPGVWSTRGILPRDQSDQPDQLLMCSRVSVL